MAVQVKKPQINVAYLIQMFYKTMGNGRFQDFYNQPRRYMYLEKNMKLTPEEKKNGKYLSLEERKAALLSLKPERINTKEANKNIDKEEHLKRKDYKKVCENEAVIRMYQVQDVLLLLMMKDIFLNVFDDVKSENIVLDMLEELFDRSVDFSLKYKKVILNAKRVKIKDYGKVCRLNIDIKFKTYADTVNKFICSSDEIFTVDYNNYLREEDIFEDCRIKMVKLCREIEDKIVHVFYSDEDLKNKLLNVKYFRFGDVIKQYNDKYSVLDSDEMDFFIQARNMFMHSNYKDECVKYVYEKYFNGSLDDLSFAEKIYERFVELYDKLDDDIKQRC